MTACLLLLVLAAHAADETDAPPKRSAVAPSLPALTREEEDRLDEVVDRFMLADTGRLAGGDARRAVREFEGLKMEAVPALIRGLNKAAGSGHSCPVLMIGKKLRTMLLGSADAQLLEYARDEIGAGVGRTRYAGALQDLRFQVLMRKNALARLPAPPRGPRELSTAELARAAATEDGPRLKAVMVELEGRKGREALAGLAAAAARPDADARKLGRDALDRTLGRAGEDAVKEQLAGADAELRRAGARAAARFPALAGYVVDLLADDRDEVRAEAHAALVRLAPGQDFGPEPGAGVEESKQAVAKWRAWVDKAGGR